MWELLVLLCLGSGNKWMGRWSMHIIFYDPIQRQINDLGELNVLELSPYPIWTWQIFKPADQQRKKDFLGMILRDWMGVYSRLVNCEANTKNKRAAKKNIIANLPRPERENIHPSFCKKWAPTTWWEVCSPDPCTSQEGISGAKD